VATKTGDSVQLAANTQLKVDAAGKAEPVHALPSVPALLAPQHQTEITYQDPARATTLLVWKPVPGATAYHVMLDYNAYFNRPLVDRTGITEPSVEVRGLDVGKYYWRVAAVDKDNAEEASPTSRASRSAGPRGPVHRRSAPIIIESIDVRQNILQVRGRTAGGDADGERTAGGRGQRGAFKSSSSLVEKPAGSSWSSLRGINGAAETAAGDGGR
jgi:hypothetical protein